MTSWITSPVASAAAHTWLGFVCAISFMEAWLKFRARGMTVPLGLEVGRLVFKALNRVEWCFAAIILLYLLLSGGAGGLRAVPYYIAAVLLLLQSAWLLPALDARVEQLLAGKSLPPSRLHFYYVGMEVVKTIALFIFGIILFN